MSSRKTNLKPPLAGKSAPRSTATWLQCSLLIALAIIAYWPSLNGGFIWDDDVHVSQNPMLLDTVGLYHIWFSPGATPQYYPLTHSTFWIEWHLWGRNTTGYKTSNLILHAINALLIFRILRRLGFEAIIAQLASAIFLLHPTCVESVAWITERKNTLSLCCELLALLMYLRFDTSNRNWRWWGASLLLFCCALLAKSVTASLPAVIIVILVWRRGKFGLRDLWPLVPFLLVGLVSGLFTAHMERETIGAIGPRWIYGPTWMLDKLARCVIAGRAIWFYLFKLIWPTKLAFIYQRWNIDARQAWEYLFPISMLALFASLFFLRRKIGGGPLAALCIFAGVLTPALGFLNVYPHRYSFVADHFQYHASVAMIVLFASALRRAAKRLTARGTLRPQIAPAAVVVLLLGLASLTWSQAHIYRDVGSIWIDTLNQSNGHVPMAAHNYAMILHSENRVAEAEEMLNKSLADFPNDISTMLLLGQLSFERGDLSGAEAMLRRAIATPQMDRDDVINLGYVHGVLAEVLKAQKRFADARNQYMASISMNPSSDIAHQRYGEFLLEQGETEAADRELREALRLNPKNDIARKAISNLQRQNP